MQTTNCFFQSRHHARITSWQRLFCSTRVPTQDRTTFHTARQRNSLPRSSFHLPAMTAWYARPTVRPATFAADQNTAVDALGIASPAKQPVEMTASPRPPEPTAALSQHRRPDLIENVSAGLITATARSIHTRKVATRTALANPPSEMSWFSSPTRDRCSANLRSANHRVPSGSNDRIPADPDLHPNRR